MSKNDISITQPAKSHSHHHEGCDHSRGTVLTIRANSGLSGDIFLAGLLRMTKLDEAETDGVLSSILPELSGALHLTRRTVNNVGGWFAEASLPVHYEHRTLAHIVALIAASGMSDKAKLLATNTFTLLANAEAVVHEKTPKEIHFHEVGALDSILDICMSCELFSRLAPSHFVVSPLPLADGSVTCAHGILTVPAPAVMELLEGIPVCSFPGRGETVTPTAVALLRSLGAVFGPWPVMCVERQSLVYGSRVFPNAPNGAIFAYGTGHLVLT